MKKKVLFVIGSFNAGGAERSMVSQLNAFDAEKYEIYLYIFNPTGVFSGLVPKEFKTLAISDEIKALNHRPLDIGFFAKHPLLWIKKIIRTTIAKLSCKGFDINQKIWQYWKYDVPSVEIEFDAAVGHMEGIPNYFVTDKVKAKNKILWIHSQYEKLGYNIEYDYEYFRKATKIVTISSVCVASLQKCFPELQNICELPNISSYKMIKSMAGEPLEKGEFNNSGYKIISIGRLVPLKNFPLAIRSAKLLKDNGMSIEWLIIGDGPEKNNLQRMIKEQGLSNDVKLLGLRANPYKYYANADVVVHTSTYEGKSIVVDEAQMLNKVVVSTDYETVGDAIADGENGIIAKMNPESVSQAIQKSLENIDLREKIISTLQSLPKGNEEQIANYYKEYGL